jgi:predicted metalloendopeptidase
MKIKFEDQGVKNIVKSHDMKNEIKASWAKVWRAKLKVEVQIVRLRMEVQITKLKVEVQKT